MRRKVEDYEADPDRHHTLNNVLVLGRTFSIEDRLATWGRFLSFDALIGNTDRHPDKLGLPSYESWGRRLERLALSLLREARRHVVERDGRARITFREERPAKARVSSQTPATSPFDRFVAWSVF